MAAQTAADLIEAMKQGARVDGGKVKINEHGEMYIERRGRKPGNKVKKEVKAPLSHASSSSSLAGAGTPSIGAARRRASVRHALRRGVVLNSNASKLADLRDRYSSRRSILFKANCPSRAPSARAAIRVLEHAWHKNTKYSVGDIISITDEEDEKPYFAQVRGLVVDPMMKAYASLTWLIPKGSAPNPHRFEPEHFGHGLVDAKNHPLEVCEWISGRPREAAYRSEWSVRKAAANASRADVLNRWRQLQAVAAVELKRSEQKPLMDLEERRVEERLWTSPSTSS